MKFIFMLLILFVLTDPVLANPANNTSECQQLQNHDLSDDGLRKFTANQGLPPVVQRLSADTVYRPVNSYQPRHQKLLRIIHDNKKILTVRI